MVRLLSSQSNYVLSLCKHFLMLAQSQPAVGEIVASSKANGLRVSGRMTTNQKRLWPCRQGTCSLYRPNSWWLAFIPPKAVTASRGLMGETGY